jgi:hypothetical protein
MAKLTHLLVLSVLILWLAVSGCVGNSTDKEKAGTAPDVSEIDGVPENSENGLTQADIQELDNDMADLQSLLENTTPEDKITLDEIQK